MAIDAGNKHELGQFLAVGFQHFVRQNASDAVLQYWVLKARGDDTGAVRGIKRAVDLPRRLRARLNLWVQQYDARTSAGSAQALMIESLALFGEGKLAPTTLAQVNTRLTAMEDYCAALVVNAPAPYGNGSTTWDQIATQIGADVEWEPTLTSRLPMPVGYVDIWGE